MIELNPNCSEATVRLRTDFLNEKEKKALEDYIIDLEKDTDFWYEANWYHHSMFGMEIISINGDMPYNHYDDLIDKLSKLPFWGKIEHEYDE